MKKSIIITILLAICLLFAEKIDSKHIEYDFDSKTYSYNGKLFTGTSVMKDSQGKPVMEIEIKNGEKHGFETTIVNGKISSKFHYVNNVKEGKSYIYSLRDFNLYEIAEYKNGKKHGLVQTFDTSKGNLKSESYYKDGKRNGEYKLFFANGKLKTHGFYIKRKKSGKWIYYKEDGSIRKEKNYK